ncbi:MAG: hypothetical protein HGA78_06685, partial [Nitrospirales bacterium]|nr:hypothetical protein [Nitrospirales bacterium]
SKIVSRENKRDISAIMRKVRSADTSPEVILRDALKEKGLVLLDTRVETLPGKPDVVLPEGRIAIFIIDGDFWHGGQSR